MPETVRYDPEAIAMTGRIVARQPGDSALVRQALDRLEQAKWDAAVAALVLSMATYSSGVIWFPVGPQADSVQGVPIEYRVQLVSGSQVRLVHYHGGFEVGDCVTVFISKTLSVNPVRMAYSTESCTTRERI